MYEFWYQVECDGYDDGGEFTGSTAQECADYIRKEYDDGVKIISIVRVESDWR